MDLKNQSQQPKHQTDKRLKPIDNQIQNRRIDTPFKIKHPTEQQIGKFFSASTKGCQYPEYDSIFQKSQYFKFDKIQQDQNILSTNEKSKYQFSCFNIHNEKIEQNNEFMGAFTHLQNSIKNPFDINLKIPSINQYSAFSNLLSFQNSSYIDSSFPKVQTHSLLLNELQDSISQTQQRRKILENQDSIFFNLEPILNYQAPQRNISNMWQQNQFANNNESLMRSSLIYSAILQKNTEEYESKNSFFFEPSSMKLTQQMIINNLTKVLQGIQTELFQINYSTMTWSITTQLNFRIENYYKQSFKYFLENVLEVANYKSRIEVALEYLKIKDVHNNKYIYAEVYNIYLESLTLFEEQEITFLEFQLSVRKLKTEIKLLYTFLIRENGKFYYEFDHSFIYTEKQLFHMGLNRLMLNDFSQQNQKILIKKLTYSSFKPILFSLNIILHYGSKQWEQQFYQHYYFSLFFEKKKDLLEIINKMTTRLNILQNQDYQIYMICRQKRNIQLTTTYNELRLYQKQWNQLFKKKIKLIREIQNQQNIKRKKKIDEIYEKKSAQIAEMKLKLIKRLQQQAKQKSETQSRQNEYIKKLKQQIQRKQEEQRLTKLIEIEREKGYLLDFQLKQKMKLINDKYQLLGKFPEELQQNKGKMMMIQYPISKNKEIEQNSKKNNYHFEQKKEQMIIQSQKMIQQKSQKIQQKIIKKNSTLNEKSVMKMQIQIPKENLSQTNQKYIDQNKKQQFMSAKKELNKTYQDNITLEIQFQQIQLQVPIDNVLQICVINVINKELEIVNTALSSLIYTKYMVASIFEFFRCFFLSSKGHYFIQLIQLSVDKNSFINLNYLKECFFFDPSLIKQQISNLEPNFYKISSEVAVNINPKNVNLMGTLNLLQQNLELNIGFEFKKLPLILKPYFSTTHLKKYMEIFNFILKLRHCEHLVQAEWKTLNLYEKILRNESQKPYQIRLIKQLYSIRYEIQVFLLRYQNYLYFYVIQKQYKILKNYLNSKEFQNLAETHMKFLDRIIFRGFINNPNQNISNKLKNLFISIRDFNSIVNLFCLDDIATYLRGQIQKKLFEIKGKIQEFSKVLEFIMTDK